MRLSRLSRLACLVAPLLAVGSLAASASAQTLPSVDVRTWRPSTDPGASLVLEPMAVPGFGEWNVGAWADYANHPVTLRLPGSNNVAYRPVSNLLGADLTAALGLGARLSLGVDLPVFLFQDGTSGLPAAVSTTPAVPTTGAGDLAFDLKGSLIGNDGGNFGLAAVGTITVPTGDAGSFLGDGAATVGARLLADYSLVFADVQASLGYTLRTLHHTWPDPSVGGYRFGDVVPWSLGLRVSPTVLRIDRSNRQTWEVAAHGWLPAGPIGPFGSGRPGSAAMSPALLALSDRIAIGHTRDVFALAGVDIGLDTAVGVPTVRFLASVGWAPRLHDQDHDNVPDDVDQCPEIAEDRDGFEDADGCPDIDDDDDGIVDTEDACRRVPGVASSDPHKNGCPAPDADGDGVPDSVDACPKLKGVKSDDPKRNGCPVADRDGDGIPDDIDKCPDQPEDKDGFQDEDGCPDPDNDGDGIPDAQDACVNVPGEPSSDPRQNGCPNPDRDGDGYDNDVDECPDAAEVYNGVKDEDGCPDEGGKPLIVAADRSAGHARAQVRFSTPLSFTGAADSLALDKASVTELHALALELNRHRDWTVTVGARGDTRPARVRATIVAQALARFTHRDDVATATTWDAVARVLGGADAVGILISTSDAQARSPVSPPTPGAAPAAPRAR